MILEPPLSCYTYVVLRLLLGPFTCCLQKVEIISEIAILFQCCSIFTRFFSSKICLSMYFFVCPLFFHNLRATFSFRLLVIMSTLPNSSGVFLDDQCFNKLFLCNFVYFSRFQVSFNSWYFYFKGFSKASIYHTHAIISRSLYFFYPFFTAAAAYITDNLCTKNGNSSSFKPKICSL